MALWGQQPRNGSACKAFESINWQEGISLSLPRAPYVLLVNLCVAQHDAVCGAGVGVGS